MANEAAISDAFKSIRQWSIPLLLLMIANVIIQTFVYKFFWYTMLEDLWPGLLAIFEGFQALSYALLIAAIWRYGEKITLCQPLVVLSFVAFVLFGIGEFFVLLYHPARNPDWFHLVTEFGLVTSVTLILTLVGYYLVGPQQRYHKVTWFGIGTAVMGFLFWNALGFLYYPNIFEVFSIYYGFFGGVSGLEWVAQFTLAGVWGWHAWQWKKGGPSRRSMIRAYTLPFLIFAVALSLGIIQPFFHCLGVFLEINVDICIESVFLGSWGSIVGVAFLVSALKILRATQPDRVVIDQDGTTVAVQDADGHTGENDVEARASLTERGAALQLSKDRRRRRWKTCLVVTSFILLPIIVLLVLIFSMPFLSTVRENALVRNVDVPSSLTVCELEYEKGGSALCLWSVRDQQMTGADVNRSAAIYKAHYKDFKESDFFSRWHFGWAMNNIYQFASGSERAAVQDAFDISQAEAKALGGSSQDIMTRTGSNVLVGFAHPLGRIAAHQYLVVPRYEDWLHNPQAWLDSVDVFKRRRGM